MFNIHIFTEQAGSETTVLPLFLRHPFEIRSEMWLQWRFPKALQAHFWVEPQIRPWRV